MPVPEIGRQLARAAVEQIGVLEHLVIEIILGGEPQRARLDPHIDILADQNHLALGMGFLQMFDYADDLVIGLAACQTRGQLAADRLCLQKQASRSVAAVVCMQLDAVLDVVLGCAYDFVEKAARLPRIARDLRHTFLVIVELFESRHRNVDVVFLEAKQAGRIVHEHVGVEHKQLDVGRKARDYGSGFALGHVTPGERAG